MGLRNQPNSLGGLPIQIDYTARDYESIRTELLRISEKLSPTWTDKEPGDIGVTILEAVAYLGDILSYGLDRAQNESYLATAQTRDAVVNLLRLINYELSPATPATVSMVIKTTIDFLTLPAGFTVKTEATEGVDSLQYQLTEAVTLGPAGHYCVSYEQAKAARTFSAAMLVDDGLIFVAGAGVVESVGVSDGSKDQFFLLGESPVCLSSDATSALVVYVGATLWTAKPSFIGTNPTDQVFTYKFLSTQELLLQFGDGVNGAIPPTNDVIQASYRIDGGEEGNRAGVGSIVKHSQLAGVDFVYNVSQPSGGSDPEDIQTAKKQGPLSLRALDRCVTLEDFETMAKKTPGGGISAARASQGDSPLEVNIYVATQGVNPIPTGKWFSEIQNGYGTIGAVGRFLLTKKPLPTTLNVLAPTPINPYFSATVYLFPNVLTANVQYEVDLSIQSLFTTVTNEFGEGVPLSAVIQIIENTQGVDYLDVGAFHRIPQARFVSGKEEAFEAAVVEVDDRTEQTQRETYSLLWISGTMFHLRGRGVGFILDANGEKHLMRTNQVNSVYLYNTNPSDTEPSQLDQFELQVTTGAATPNSGDVWEFTVDNYLGNIEAEPHEIVVAPLLANGRVDPDQFELTYSGGL